MLKNYSSAVHLEHHVTLLLLTFQCGNVFHTRNPSYDFQSLNSHLSLSELTTNFLLTYDLLLNTNLPLLTTRSLCHREK